MGRTGWDIGEHSHFRRRRWRRSQRVRRKQSEEGQRGGGQSGEQDTRKSRRLSCGREQSKKGFHTSPETSWGLEGPFLPCLSHRPCHCSHNTYLTSLFHYLLTPLECQLEAGMHVSSSLIHSPHLEWCLAQSRHRGKTSQNVLNQKVKVVRVSESTDRRSPQRGPLWFTVQRALWRKPF